MVVAFIGRDDEIRVEDVTPVRVVVDFVSGPQNDTKVRRATAYAEKEIRIFGLRDGKKRTVGRDKLDGEEIIDDESVKPLEAADTTGDTSSHDAGASTRSGSYV